MLKHISVNPEDYIKETKRRLPPHEKAAMVDEILKLAPATKKFNYGYWLALVNRSRIRYSELLGIIKSVREAPPHFPKGALITNSLKKLVPKKVEQKSIFPLQVDGE